ncbi:MAG TPA: DUF2934 domain-containing protein [Microvirga sp.]|jgi:hypothetical protein
MTIDLEQKIRERAYQIWEQNGRLDGHADEHWHAAKLELTAGGDAPILAEVPKKRRRAAPEAPAPVPNPAPRRRRPAATLQ